MESTLESHPQKKIIVEMILKGFSSRKIGAAVSPQVDFHAVQRYKNSVIKPAASKVLLAQQSTVNHQAVQGVAAVDPFLSRMASDRAERARVKALAAPADATLATADLRAWCAADRNDIAATELEARLCGRLDAQAGPQVTVTVVCPTSLQPVPPILDKIDGVIDLRGKG